MRIAILEDDPDQLALLKRWIGDDGHDVHGWLSGREAMRQAGRESFDLFMLDWQVPDISGTEVLSWLRNNVSKTVPILFVTVRDSEQDIVFALEHGADDYMRVELTPKEFELAVTLFRNVGRLLSRGHLQETVWGRSGDLATRTVDTHVSQVRKKLDLRPESGYRVVPVYNYGYRLERLEPTAR